MVPHSAQVHQECEAGQAPEDEPEYPGSGEGEGDVRRFSIAYEFGNAQGVVGGYEVGAPAGRNESA